MNKFTGLGVLGLALGSLLFTGCTAKYNRLLDERDREIVSLKDQRSRLQVELRGLKEQEESLKGRVKVAEEERARLFTKIRTPRQIETPKPVSGGKALAPELRRFAADHGIEVKQRPEGAVLVLPGSITFNSGSVKLSSRGRRILDQLANTIRRHFASRTISVEGHTDSQPIVKSKFGTNYRLSAERAESVRAYLSKKGVGKRGVGVRVVGYGPTQPAASNRGESGRRKNRRVELVILNV